MMTAVKASSVWVIVVPATVIDRNPHFGRVAVVETISATVIFVSPVVVWIIDVRVVVESFPVLSCVSGAPRTAIGLLSLNLHGRKHTANNRCAAARHKKDPTDH